jgi:2'-5' RNA ligase
MARLFVALAPDPDTRARLAAAAEALRGALGPAARDLRFGAPATLHLTLRFLGEVEAARVEAVAGAVREAALAAAPLTLAVRGAGAFPTPRHPRAVFLALDGGAPLAALVAGLEEHLLTAGFPREARAFRPHLTVARPRGRARVPQLDAALAAAVVAPLAWPASAVTLFESHLLSGGARHDPLVVAPLGAPGAQPTGTPHPERGSG